MQKFLWCFLWIIALYHIFVTIIWYGVLWWESQVLISIIRDSIRLFFVLVVISTNFKLLKKYFLKWKKVRIWLIVLIFFSIGISYLFGKNTSDIMIGIKYWFYYLVIFLTASIVWFLWIKKLDISHIQKFQIFLFAIVFFWFVWQIMKMIKPELFLNIWYWKFDDFYFWANPPLYYLTWYEWTTRRQWIFSGPNNYGYFLIAFLPIILLRTKSKIKRIKDIFLNPLANIDIILLIIWVLAIIMTLSRSAIIWMAFVLLIFFRTWIKKNKKIVFWVGWILVLGIIWLSISKYESTIWHIKSKTSYIFEIVNNPLWHWLGTSGPAIHHEWSMLPENYFMQIMLDIWTVWFLIWSILIFHILAIFKSIENYFLNKKESKQNNLNFLQWKMLYLWWSALLIMWFFLHVFEDSMVNYLFFVSFGLLSGYLSKLYENNKLWFKDIFKKH